MVTKRKSEKLAYYLSGYFPPMRLKKDQCLAIRSNCFMINFSVKAYLLVVSNGCGASTVLFSNQVWLFMTVF